MIPGVSPLVGGYNQWVSGRAVGPGLPRPFNDFLGGAFGPLSPLTPMPIDQSPEDEGRAGPRRLQYPIGWNLPVGQPGTEGFKLAPFSVLYKYADMYSVGRACVNIRRDEMAGLSWDVGPTANAQADTKGDKGAAKDQRQRSQKIVQWFKRIDSNYYGFQSWFTAVLEQQIVIDAVSLYLAPTRVDGKGLFGSDLSELQLLDGSTIRPLYDLSGSKPRPPSPAYQQYLWGVPRSEYLSIINDADLETMKDDLRAAGVDDDIEPAQEYRADQLLYIPRLPRINTPYGMSMVEQALIPFTLGMLRQNYLLDFYGEGSIPGTFVIAGTQYVTPAQQRQLQDTLNAIAGDQAWKHRIIVLPPGSSTDPQKNMDGQYQLDQMIGEQVAMIAHIQPHELGMVPGGRTSGLGGKGMAQQQQQSVTAQRTEPDRKWWKEVCFDYIIQRMFKQDDLEFKWIDFEEEEDDSKKAATQQTRIFSGQSTIDEERIEDGKDAWDLPLTQSPFIMQGGQVIPLDPSVSAPVPPAPPGGGGMPGAPGPAGTALSAALQPELGKNPEKPKNNPGAALLSDKKKDRKKARHELANRFESNLKDVTKHPPNKYGTGASNAEAPQGAAPTSAAPTPAGATQPNVQPPSGVVAPAKKKDSEPDFAPMTVAELVKARIKYKDSKLPQIVHDYLLRSYPADKVDWVLQDGTDWEYEPKVKLSDINMARRPGGRNPEKVNDISNSMKQGASIDPIVLVERQDQSEYKYDIADGWHRTLGAEDAGLDEIPAFIGEGFDDKTDWGLEMQDTSDSKKAQAAEIAVLRRYLRKGGQIAQFKPAALDPVQMRLLSDDLSRMDANAALDAARERIAPKNISISAPLATGVVPFDLDGQQGEGRRCSRCNAPMTKFERGDVCTDCHVTDLAGGSEFKGSKRVAADVLLAKIESELLKRGINPLELAKSDTAHAPAGSPQGGQFTSSGGTGGNVGQDQYSPPSHTVTPKPAGAPAAKPKPAATPTTFGKPAKTPKPKAPKPLKFPKPPKAPKKAPKPKAAPKAPKPAKPPKAPTAPKPVTPKPPKAPAAPKAPKPVTPPKAPATPKPPKYVAPPKWSAPKQPQGTAAQLKYSADQGRDEEGRFSDGGGGRTGGSDEERPNWREQDWHQSEAPGGARQGSTGPSVASMRDALRENGGFTLNVRTGQPPTTGYVVAIQGHSGIMSKDQFMSDDKAANAFVGGWIDSHTQELRQAGWIGGWADTAHNEVTLDPVENIQDRAQAVQMGQDRNQQSVWDVVNSVEIPTGGTGDRPEG